MLFVWVTSISAQNNSAPEVMASGDQTYCPQTAIPVATSFNIIDVDDTEIESFHIQISTGYQRGQDMLRLENNHPMVTTTWNNQEGKMTFRGPSGGPVAYTDLIAAVNDVVFESTSESPAEEKFFSFTIGSANYLPETQHYYEYIPNLGIRWDDARTAAENRTFFGLQGYLATVTSEAEAQLTGEQAAGTGWIGGSDEETEGTWKWVTGPEAGQIFWNGNVTGSSPNFAFWNNQEPNNLNGETGAGEDYAHVTAPGVGIAGSWNDLPVGGNLTGDYQPKGYIVEYGGLPGDPILTLSASTKLTTPRIAQASSGSVCGPGTVTLEAESTRGDVVWFDVATGGVPLAAGNTFQTPWLTNTTTFYAMASYNGCLTGERIAVEAEVKLQPLVNEGFTISNCDEDGVMDGFTDFDLTQYLHLIKLEDINLDITFYLTETDAENQVNELSATLFNNSIANELYFRAEGSGVYCHSVGNLFLDVTTTSFPQNYLYELTTCDEDTADGISVFDLNEAEADMLAQFPSGQDLSVSFYQNEDDAFLKRNQIANTTTYYNNQAYSEMLYVRIEDEQSGTCYGVGEHLLLTVFPIPSFEVKEKYVFCSGDEVQVTPINADGNHQYIWYNAQNEIVGNDTQITISEIGDYRVEAVSVNGCHSEQKNFEVRESGPPMLSSQFVKVDYVGDSGTISILHEDGELGLGDYEFSLDNPFGPEQDEGFFSNVEAGVHTLYAWDKNGCGMDQMKVGVIGVSKFFTPNNDGINDEVKVVGITGEFYREGTFSVFDRYGKLLARRNPMQAGWNGLYNGSPLPPSDYWYVLELVDFDGVFYQKKGHFTLKQ
ncbi:T9SS type B sorting domain-containing protein [Flagellimonas iocasae]|uniref:T9SS type B sorting domain-containing protein n=1 Tax=Flagellimonas iocasae TaxID=2055905 RepID=A0ABW4Y5Y0_9FLAO